MRIKKCFWNIINLTLLFVNIFLLISYLKFNSDWINNRKYELNSECECFKNHPVTVENFDSYFQIEYLDKKYFINSNKADNMVKNTINNKSFLLTCDLYKSLKRGPNQKIISFSLYGKNEYYYKKLKNISNQIRQFYPDHLMRIYYNNSIKKSVICELECKEAHIDFCNIHKIPIDNFEYLPKNYFDVDYIHSMLWRFLPIGDSFVDIFSSRDTDSLIFQREIDSFNEWMNSDNIGHIMRDNPYHTSEILGGMWGFKNYMNRSLSTLLFNKILDKNNSKKFKINKVSKKGKDQNFLNINFYPYIVNKSTIHDSFLCKKYPNSKPFPSKRIGNCFVGMNIRFNVTGTFYTCPIECRPKDHIDWIYC